MYLNIKLKSIKINYKIINLIKSNRIHSFQFSPSSVVSFIHSFIHFGSDGSDLAVVSTTDGCLSVCWCSAPCVVVACDTFSPCDEERIAQSPIKREKKTRNIKNVNKILRFLYFQTVVKESLLSMVISLSIFNWYIIGIKCHINLIH